MRNRLAWLIALAGFVAFARRRRARPRPALEAAGDSRAQDLRRKLDESRGLVAEREEFEAAETTIDQARPAAGGLEERRRQVHEIGQAAAEEMRGRAADASNAE